MPSRTTSPALAIALFLFPGLQCAPQDDASKDNPLKPLAEIGKGLNEGIQSFMKGKSPQEAFKPWKVTTPSPAFVERFRSQLKEAGVQSAVLAWIEYDITLYSGAEAIYHLGTVVQVSEGQVRFLGCKGRSPEGGKMSPRRGTATGDWKGSAGPFGEAAKALIEVCRSGKDPGIPVADAEELTSRIPTKEVREHMKKTLAETRESIPECWTAIGKLNPDRIEVRLDDAGFFALDSEGQAKGMIKGEFETESGGLVYKFLGWFEPFGEKGR